jgi:acetyl esterase/lipase
MARTTLLIRTLIFRFFQAIGRYFDHYLSYPLPPRPSFKLRISTTIGTPGFITLYFYVPASYPTSSTPLTQSSSLKKFPILLNFHGGGYTIGHATDDARFAATVLKQNPNSVVVSVDYRLSPTYPFPTGIEDCASALLYLWANASKLHLDASRTCLSGFSAGGNFCFASAYRAHEEQARLRGVGCGAEYEEGKIVGIAAFYPALIRTKTREERAASNPNFKPIPIPKFLAAGMDESYLYPMPEDMSVPLLSPGLASDELLRVALPRNIVMITCWGDALLVEGEEFRERLKGLGFRVEGYTVPGVLHGWDKWPSYWKGDRERDEAYEVVGRCLGEFWEGK